MNMIFFAHLKSTTEVTHAFPYICNVIRQMLDFHQSQYLPKHLSTLFLSTLNLRKLFEEKSYQRVVKRTKPGKDYVSCIAE